MIYWIYTSVYIYNYININIYIYLYCNPILTKILSPNKGLQGPARGSLQSSPLETPDWVGAPEGDRPWILGPSYTSYAGDVYGDFACDQGMVNNGL